MGVAAAVFVGQSAGSIPLASGTQALHEAVRVAAPCAVGEFAGYEANGIALCAHPDHASTAAVVVSPQVLPGIPCYPSTAPSVHVYYAYEQGKPNRLAAQLPQIRDLVAQTDAVYATSATQSGGTRHVRWLMSGSCHLVVTPVVVPVSPNPFAPMAAVARAHNLRPTDHALIFLDWSGHGSVCGWGSSQPDTRPGPVNISNHYQGMAEVYSDAICRRDATSPAHELGHTLGAVQKTAPHASYGGHCYDGFTDVMCYDDGLIPAPMRAGLCPDGTTPTMDCGHDDYYNAKPATGSYLASHWDVASSVLLPHVRPTKWDVVPNPTVTLTNPVPGQVLDASAYDQTPVTVAVDAAGATVAQVQYYLDKTRFNNPATVAPYDGSQLADFALFETTGPHRIYARLTLTNGIVRTSPAVIVNVVNGKVAPVVAAAAAKLTLKAGTTLHSGGTGTFPFALLQTKAHPTTVQIITKSGWMRPVPVTASARTAVVRLTQHASGSDSVWLRIDLSDGTMVFTNHVPVSWR